MIPTNRPVLGRDLDEIKQAFGLSTADACWLFGLSITKWTHVVRQGADTPVKDPTLALVVRLLDANPDLNVVPQPPTSQELFDLLKESLPELDQKRFSIIMGSEATAGYRWLKVGSHHSPTLSRLMLYMNMALMRLSRRDRVKALEQWRETVELEASARGVDNVFSVGRWTTTTPANDAVLGDIES